MNKPTIFGTIYKHLCNRGQISLPEIEIKGLKLGYTVVLIQYNVSIKKHASMDETSFISIIPGSEQCATI